MARPSVQNAPTQRVGTWRSGFDPEGFVVYGTVWQKSELVLRKQVIMLHIILILILFVINGDSIHLTMKGRKIISLGTLKHFTIGI